MRLQFLTLWAINGALDEEKLKEQLREMKDAGFDGTIFHPRYYPGKPLFMGEEYLQILSGTILCAKELGLEFWIYDENGWPSASADGQVLAHFPDSRCEWLVYRDGAVVKESRVSFNTFDREQMKFFVQTIYDGYREGLAQEAFDYVTGFSAMRSASWMGMAHPSTRVVCLIAMRPNSASKHSSGTSGRSCCLFTTKARRRCGVPGGRR